eukprot:2254807-Pleurochrysis_carterae.AAC.4
MQNSGRVEAADDPDEASHRIELNEASGRGALARGMARGEEADGHGRDVALGLPRERCLHELLADDLRVVVRAERAPRNRHRLLSRHHVPEPVCPQQYKLRRSINGKPRRAQMTWSVHISPGLSKRARRTSSSGLKGSDRNSGMALRPFGFSFVCDSKQPIARVTVCTPSKRSSSNVAPSRIARSRSLLTTPVCAVVRETARPARQSTALQSPSPATVRHRPPLQSSNVIAVLPENRFCDPLASSITSFSVTRNPSNNARLADASSLSTTLEDKTLRYNASWQYWDVCASPWPLNTPKKAKSLLRCTVLRSCMEPQPA